MAGTSSDIPKRYTGARDTTFARSARNNWIPISKMRRKIAIQIGYRKGKAVLGYTLCHNMNCQHI